MNYCLRLACICMFLLWSMPHLQGQPAGFVDQEYVGGFAQAVGMTFDANGRMYVWEKGGKIWIVENGERLPNPLLDISEEVGNWRDFGLLGVALHPDFLSNGYIYLLYIVDRHHLLYAGTSDYNPNTNEYFNATIGRITRYKAEASTNFTTIDYASRTVLLGDSPSTGFPNLHQSHGTGSLIFGTDKTLIASFGDGASYSSVDQGSASETYYQQAIDDGIIPANHNIGAYRSQLLNSLAGKALRIDPITGAGLPSNPFYQAGNPNSIQSRVWARGLRNPCRMTLKPETGSHDPSVGNPGTVYIGDVGWGTREEINVMDVAGLNFGWPKYEGMTHQPGYNNNSYAPSNHELAKVDWRTNAPRAYVNGTIYNVGSNQVPGPSFNGNCSIGGVWYHGDDFPEEYHNTYFHADYGGDWIRNFSFDANDNCTAIRNFKSGADAIVFVATDPNDGGLYYIGGASGSSNNNTNAIRKISYTGGNLPPIVSASANLMYGTSPLNVQFTGALSYDPDGQGLTYSWNFGDGNNSSEVNPSHTYTTGSNQPTSFTATLTVSDTDGLSSSQDIIISLNNTPPQILSTSIDNINTFSVDNSTLINLSATVTDAEHNNGSLTYEWLTELHHNDHFHQEPVDNNSTTTTELSPIGCDGSTYFYRIKLRVIDPAGLSSSFQKDIFPNCNGNTQTISFNAIPDKLTIDAPFALSASSNSGLPVILHVVQGPATISGNTVTLSGAPGIVTVRAIQSGNSSYAPALPVEHQFTVTPPGGTGLKGNYFNNINLSNFVLERIDPLIDFDWGSGSPDPSIGANTYSIRWEGEVLPLYSEIYTFTTTTDDGVRLWVNDQLIINQWIDQAATSHSGNINLTGGQRVSIVMEFYENGGGASAKLAWNSNSQAAQIIPQFLLFPESEPEDTAPPTAILSTPSNTVSGNFLVTVTFNENINGLGLNDFNLNNGTASNLSGNGLTYTFSVNPQNTGNVSIQLPANRVQDDAGNNNLVSNTLNVNYTPDDTTPPTVTLSTPSNEVDGIFVVSVAFSENINGLSLGDFNITNGTASNLNGNGANYSFSVSPQAEGNVSVRLPANRVQDDAANNNTTSNILNANYSEPSGGGCTNPQNIALNKTASQSSDYSSNGAEAALAIDGNTNGNWYLDFSVSSTGWQTEAWWEVDLNSISDLQEVKVWNRTDCCSDFLTDYYILISETPFTSESLSVLLNQSSVTSFHQTTIAGTPTTIPTSANGRYLRIQRTGTGFMALAEVEVIGCEGSPGVDTTPPDVTLSTAANNVSDAFTVDIQFSEAITGLSTSNIHLTNATASNLSGSGASYSVLITPQVAGNVTVHLHENEVADLAGNFNNASNELSINYDPNGVDNTPPDITLSTSNTNVNGAFTVNGLFSEAVTGMDISSFQVSNGTASNITGGGASYGILITPIAEGTVTISIPANEVYDLAGNANNASNLLTVSYIAPGSGDCTALSNLSLNGTASQSSDYSNTGAGADLAIDGNTNGNWYDDFSVSSTGWQNQPWWKIDLGEISTIEKIKVWNRTDCCSNFLGNYYIFVSNVPFLSEDLNATLNQAGVSNFHQTTIAGTPSSITINQSGRYVRIQNNNAGFMALAEVEVIGCNDGGPGMDTTPPSVTLSTPSQNVTGSFTITANFSEVVTGLSVGDFGISNGTASGLSGNGINYSFEVTPSIEGNVSINLPANTVADVAGNDNTASNTLTINYTEPGGGGTCTTASNLALNGTAAHSSVYGSGGGGPELAIDGNTSGNWYADFSVSSTGWQNTPWWEVDLGSISTIDQLNLWNRTDCCSDFLSDYYIFVSDVPFVSENLNDVLAQSGVSSYPQNTVAGSPSLISIGRSGRYVRIQSNTVGFMALAEVEVMGCPLDNSNNNFSFNEEAEKRGLAIRLYPNPAQDVIIIEYQTTEAGELSYFVSNSLGELKEQKSFFADKGTGKFVIFVNEYTAGFYTFYMKLDGFRFQHEGFVKIRD